jgi:hypothetical protein
MLRERYGQRFFRFGADAEVGVRLGEQYRSEERRVGKEC